jgi:hypothetical protein
MKNIVFIFIVVLTTISAATGQARIKEKVKSHKVAYISEQLALTENEAQKFWPIYNAYQGEMEDLRISQNIKFSPDMSDAQAEELMDNMLVLRGKEIEVQRKYIKKFKTAISPRKTALLFKADREFQGKIISKIQEKRGKN